MTYALRLYKGFFSSTSLGNGGVTDERPAFIDLYGGDFSVKDTDGGNWTPQIATLKNNGVRADSVLLEGSALIAAPMGNVIETITLYAGANTTPVGRAYVFKQLAAFAQAARDFHTTEWQTLPVFIEWRAEGAPGEQYALVYNIDVSVNRHDPTNLNDYQELTITIEREPAWRAIAPGDNPKKWALYLQGGTPGIAYTYTGLDLRSNAVKANFQTATIYQWDDPTSVFIPYVTIPGSTIPGDAPALCCITTTLSTGNLHNLRIARNTRRDLYPSVNTGDGTGQRIRMNHNAVNATITSIVNCVVSRVGDANSPYYVAGGSRGYVNLAYAAGAVTAGTPVLQWTRTLNQQPGRYAVLLRCHLNSGSVADVTLQLYVDITTGNRLVTFQDNIMFTNNNLTILNMGEYDFSPTGSRHVAVDGTGINPTNTMSLFLYTTKVNSGVAANLRIYDLVLIPIDEPNCKVQSVDPGIGINYPVLVDSTGYFSSGKNTPTAVVNNATDETTVLSYIGDPLTLIPGVDNRLYFTPDFNPAVNWYPNTGTVYINIVPRWYGVRDA